MSTRALTALALALAACTDGGKSPDDTDVQVDSDAQIDSEPVGETDSDAGDSDTDVLPVDTDTDVAPGDTDTDLPGDSDTDGIDSDTDVADTDTDVLACAADAEEPDDEASPVTVDASAGAVDVGPRTLGPGDVDAFTATVPVGCTLTLGWAHDGAAGSGATWRLVDRTFGDVVLASGALDPTGSTSISGVIFDVVADLVLEGPSGACLTYTVTAERSCPRLEVAITPEEPDTTDDLTAVVTGAPAGSTVIVSWTKSGDPAPQVGATLSASHTTRGDTWTATAVLFASGVPPASASVTIGNAPPVVDALAIVTDGDGLCGWLACEVSVSDPDDDPITLARAWTLDGAPAPGDAALGEVPVEGQLAGCAITVDDGTVTVHDATAIIVEDPTVTDGDDDGVCDVADLCDGPDDEGDADGDGLCDDRDVCVGVDATLDLDGDGLCADTETALGTGDEDPDSDDDDLGDFDEWLAGTDPRLPDTDVDGLLDGVEVVIGTDPLVDDADTVEVRTIFVGSRATDGRLGWPAGTDLDYCGALARDAERDGLFVALVGTDLADPIDRVDDAVLLRTDGRVVARDRADLFDGALDRPIVLDELGRELDTTVYTGSTQAGLTGLNRHCEDWRAIEPAGAGFYGLSSHSDARWLQDGGTVGCSVERSFYCVEVADGDGDGLSDADEAWRGTDPAVPDSDGDGRTDGEEVYVDLTDPLTP